MDNYRQVELVKDSGNTQIRDIAWIPAKFATKGKVLKKKMADKTWSDGWLVIAVYGEEVAYDIINKRSRDYRKMATFKEA